MMSLPMENKSLFSSPWDICKPDLGSSTKDHISKKQSIVSPPPPPPPPALAANSQVPHDPRSPDHCPAAADKSLSSPLLSSNYRTSSQMIKATVGRVPTHNYRMYGVPTIRSDLPAPRIRRVGDSTVSRQTPELYPHHPNLVALFPYCKRQKAGRCLGTRLLIWYIIGYGPLPAFTVHYALSLTMIASMI